MNLRSFMLAALTVNAVALAAAISFGGRSRGRVVMLLALVLVAACALIGAFAR